MSPRRPLSGKPDIARIEIPQRSSPCHIEVCYAFGRKRRRRDSAPPRFMTCRPGDEVVEMKRREFITLLGAARSRGF